MYKVIVVGTDGSERASVAYRHALELAKLSGAKLHAVQVVHLAVKAGFADRAEASLEVDRMREHAERTGARLLAEAEREGISVEVHNPSAAEVADAIIGVAEDVGADLIVVGNRGMSGMTRFRARKRPEQDLPSRALQPLDRQHRSRLTSPFRGGRRFGAGTSFHAAEMARDCQSNLQSAVSRRGIRCSMRFM